ncbi:MAG: polysaccharide biosynthesis protein [Gemmatimonadetes bacterium]|nr:MAG: polysaccharide biosynthesis protein [Gemmatimonadota bacterium]
MRKPFKRIPYRFRTLVKIIADAFLILLAYFTAYLIRFEFSIPPTEMETILRSIPLVFISGSIAIALFRVYKGRWEYASIRDLISIFLAVTWGWLTFILLLNMFQLHGNPRSVLVIYWLLSLLFVGGVRFSYRIFTEMRSMPWGNACYVLVIGAGKAGEMIIRQIRNEPRLGYYPVGLVDDDPEKQHTQIHGVPVLGTIDDLEHILQGRNVDQIIIAAPSATPAEMRRIVEACERVNLEFKTVPGPKELVNGDVSISQIRHVKIEDLLDRVPVEIDLNQIRAFITGRTILITGAAGSIGSELARQILQFYPAKLVCFDRTENSLFHLKNDLDAYQLPVDYEVCVADILDFEKANDVFANVQPDVVFHAAAYKHVPLMEAHPEEAIRNNVFGTINMIRLAERYHAEKFVLISTDKAVNPTSMMGASKRLAELVVQSYAEKSDLKLVTVRFGNVLGSMGSALPLFQKQIEAGGPVTITHPEMKRFFMTIPEAVKLILEAAKMGENGEIYVLDMGEPIKIEDFARHLIRLSGLEPEKDIPITYIGMRPGEKMVEELWTAHERVQETEHRKIMRAKGTQHKTWEALQADLNDLRLYIRLMDRASIYKKVQQLIPEYKPFTGEMPQQTKTTSPPTNPSRGKQTSR